MSGLIVNYLLLHIILDIKKGIYLLMHIILDIKKGIYLLVYIILDITKGCFWSYCELFTAAHYFRY